eukprot:jgi/Galph1/4269/GphlegSOOS_G2925.1
MTSKRSQRHNILRQKGLTIWFTGIPASGKSTICYYLENKLLEQGKLCYCLDGDVLRKGLNSDLGYSNEDRSENVRRLGEVASILTDLGAITLVAVIAPFQKDRDIVRRLHEMKNLEFWEVYVECPLKICEERDPKGLYKKARAGEIPLFTGINSAYEIPQTANTVLNTVEHSLEECVDKVLYKLHYHFEGY